MSIGPGKVKKILSTVSLFSSLFPYKTLPVVRIPTSDAFLFEPTVLYTLPPLFRHFCMFLTSLCHFSPGCLLLYLAFPAWIFVHFLEPDSFVRYLWVLWKLCLVYLILFYVATLHVSTFLVGRLSISFSFHPYVHRWASPFNLLSPFSLFSPFANRYISFVSLATNRQMANFHLHYEQTD
jgi:hypothetical protein